MRPWPPAGKRCIEKKGPRSWRGPHYSNAYSSGRSEPAVQQPLDVVELELRPEALAEAAAQLFQDAPRTLHVDLARHLDRRVVAVVAPAQWPAERVGLVVGARLTHASAGLTGAGARHHTLLLHLLRQVLGAAAQRFERTALRTDRIVGIALAKLALRVTHGLAGLAKLIALALLALLTLLALLLTLLALLAEAALVELFDQLVEPVAQRLLLLRQVAHAVLVALLALLALLTLLSLLALLTALLATLTLLTALLPALILALLEGAVTQLLLALDQLAQLIELIHHLVVAIAILHLAGLGHLQIVEHRLQFLQQLAGGVLGAVASHLLQAVDHVLEILRAKLALVRIERARELLRIALRLLGERLQELVERGPQLIGEPLDLLVGGAAFERLAQLLLRLPQGGLRIGHAAVLERDRHVPHAGDHVAQLIVVLGVAQLPKDRAQAAIDLALDVELLGRIGERIERVEHARLRFTVERQRAAQLDQRARDRLQERPLRQRQLERRARAFVAGLVAGGERHDGVGTGPRMLGHILGGLPDAVLGARLRQHQRHIRRLEQAAGGSDSALIAVLQLEVGLPADDAIVVLDLVGELQGTALLSLGVLGERNRGRAVRN